MDILTTLTDRVRGVSSDILETKIFQDNQIRIKYQLILSQISFENFSQKLVIFDPKLGPIKDIRTKIEHFLTNRVKLMNLYPDIKRVIRSGSVRFRLF